MADPVEFNGMTQVVCGPPGTEDYIRPLPLARDGTQVISCWKLTPEELELVRRTGEIWISIQSGSQVFATLVTAMPLTEPAYEDLRNRLADVVRIAHG